MALLALDMASRYYPHAAAFPCAGCNGDPGGDDDFRLQAPIRQILMPGNEGPIIRRFGKERRRPAQDIRTQKFLHMIKDRRIAHQIEQFRKYNMGVGTQ